MKNRVKALRLKQNITQSQLAGLTGISQTTISEIEIGKTDDVWCSTAFKIAKYFGLEIHEVFTGLKVKRGKANEVQQ